MPRQKISPETVDLAKKLCLSGHTLTSISKQVNLSIKQLKRVLKDVRKVRQRRTNVHDVLEKFSQGMAAKEIAAQYNVDVSVIRHILRRRGISSRRSYFPCEDNKEKILSLIKSGKTQAEISSELGVKGNTLNSFIKRHAIDDLVAKNTKSTSVPEKEIAKIFAGQEVLLNYKYDGLKEIDIYLPKLKIGIEYCGAYFHRESIRGKKAHISKLNDCKNLGIKLITIFDFEWLNKPDIVSSILLQKAGLLDQKVYARQCSVSMISKQEADDFLDQNHLQGKPPNILFAVGLKFKNDLVGVISVGWHHRNKSVYILNRLCFKKNISVVGGPSKMFRLVVGELKKRGVSKIVTYSDNRWSDGNVYKKLGFVLEKELPADYFYVHTSSKKVFSKQSLKKSAEEKASGKTEYQIRLAQGYDRVWDCGKKKWTYSV